ncbi:hypothetical protein [Phenylobacterium sp.]|uniref:hypothetical protein n=1 Tax=Phenylobacterium sp. TaxID=1871053 RepID=UPI002E2FE17A|nr:hypothetical protein [Phenylobacterium sp.]HEX4712369.1 hypothetical protein [Phenylobacterium sp.]
MVDDRPQFIQKARNLFTSAIQTFQPDRLGCVLSMNANSQAQLAGLLLPFGTLNGCALDANKPCVEFISPNFSKRFFSKDDITFSNWKTACDDLIGIHPPNWTDQEYKQLGLLMIGNTSGGQSGWTLTPAGEAYATKLLVQFKQQSLPTSPTT